MVPRAYSMQGRAEKVARTRERIVDAALDVFTQRGARGTTMTEVARVADVATATVTNHFATPELLLQAVVDRVMADLRLPEPSIFAGTRSGPERLRALTAAMFEFYERTNRWFALLGAEITEVPVLATAEAEVRQALDGMYAEALAGSTDETLAKMVAGLIHPATYVTLRQVGLSLEEAIDVVAEAVGHRAARQPQPPETRRPAPADFTSGVRGAPSAGLPGS